MERATKGLWHMMQAQPEYKADFGLDDFNDLVKALHRPQYYPTKNYMTLTLGQLIEMTEQMGRTWMQSFFASLPDSVVVMVSEKGADYINNLTNPEQDL